MTQLLIKCKNCGFEFPAATQMNEEAFAAIIIEITMRVVLNVKELLLTTSQIIISNRSVINSISASDL
jgi:hypothetical protein